MQVTVTAQHIVAHYADFQTWNKAGTYGRGGPARVYFKTQEFKDAAKHYGWGDDCGPNDQVTYMGDKVPLFEVLVGSLTPVRVVR